jgi:hypothetical protein
LRAQREHEREREKPGAQGAIKKMTERGVH